MGEGSPEINRRGPAAPKKAGKPEVTKPDAVKTEAAKPEKARRQRVGEAFSQEGKGRAKVWLPHGKVSAGEKVTAGTTR